MNNSKSILVLLLCISIIACSNPRNNTDNDIGNNNNVNAGDGAGTITVLCRCKEGYVSWSGSDESSTKKIAKKNCESINGSISDCKVIES